MRIHQVLSDPNYRAAIDFCRGKRQTVIGYVYTDRAKMPLSQVRSEYVSHYNVHRPHRALGLGTPACPRQRPPALGLGADRITRRFILGGLIKEYERAA